MKQKLKFYDIKAKKAFETDSYEVVKKQTSRGPEADLPRPDAFRRCGVAVHWHKGLA